MDFAQYGPWAFIAGGSEGVGASFARKLATGGVNLVLAARKAEPLEVLAEEIRRDAGVEVRTLSLNLCDDDMLEQVRTATDDIEIGMLIYNAGAETSLAHFLDRSPGRAEMMIALNVTAPTQLAYHFGQGMRARGRGGIILVGSKSGHAGIPTQIVYAAGKAYQMALAEGLSLELAPSGVHVLALVLGLTDTPNVRRMGFSVPGMTPDSPDAVAQQGFEHLGSGDPVSVVGGWSEQQRQRMRSRGERAGQKRAETPA